MDQSVEHLTRFWLKSLYQGRGIENLMSLCAEHRACLAFSLSLHLPLLLPHHGRACSLSLSLSLKKKNMDSVKNNLSQILTY